MEKQSLYVEKIICTHNGLLHSAIFINMYDEFSTLAHNQISMWYLLVNINNCQA